MRPSSPAPDAIPTQLVDQPGQFDVLYGRTPEKYEHPGNVYFRSMVQNELDQYIAACESNNRSTKTQLILKVMHDVHKNGGRFLRPNSPENTQKKKRRVASSNGKASYRVSSTTKNKKKDVWTAATWIVVGKDDARQKISHCFRDQAASIRNNAEKQTDETTKRKKIGKAIPNRPESLIPSSSPSSSTTGIGSKGFGPPSTFSPRTFSGGRHGGVVAGRPSTSAVLAAGDGHAPSTPCLHSDKIERLFIQKDHNTVVVAEQAKKNIVSPNLNQKNERASSFESSVASSDDHAIGMPLLQNPNAGVEKRQAPHWSLMKKSRATKWRGKRIDNATTSSPAFFFPNPPSDAPTIFQAREKRGHESQQLSLRMALEAASTLAGVGEGSSDNSSTGRETSTTSNKKQKPSEGGDNGLFMILKKDDNGTEKKSFTSPTPSSSSGEPDGEKMVNHGRSAPPNDGFNSCSTCPLGTRSVRSSSKNGQLEPCWSSLLPLQQTNEDEAMSSSQEKHGNKKEGSFWGDQTTSDDRTTRNRNQDEPHIPSPGSWSNFLSHSFLSGASFQEGEQNQAHKQEDKDSVFVLPSKGKQETAFSHEKKIESAGVYSQADEEDSKRDGAPEEGEFFGGSLSQSQSQLPQNDRLFFSDGDDVLAELEYDEEDSVSILRGTDITRDFFA